MRLDLNLRKPAAAKPVGPRFKCGCGKQVIGHGGFEAHKVLCPVRKKEGK